MNSIIIPTFACLFMAFTQCFSRPNYISFRDLAIGWLLTPGKKTVVNIMRTMGSSCGKSHDAYQKFFSKQKWEVDEVNKHLFGLIILKLLRFGTILLAGDDTLCKHHGTKIFGIGIFRDPVRSNTKVSVFCSSPQLGNVVRGSENTIAKQYILGFAHLLKAASKIEKEEAKRQKQKKTRQT